MLSSDNVRVLNFSVEFTVNDVVSIVPENALAFLTSVYVAGLLLPSSVSILTSVGS